MEVVQVRLPVKGPGKTHKILITKEVKMARKNNSSRNLQLLGVLLPLFLALNFSLTSQAQINISKGVPSYTNYVVGDINLAGQQVWSVNQNKEGFSLSGQAQVCRNMMVKTGSYLPLRPPSYQCPIHFACLRRHVLFWFLRRLWSRYCRYTWEDR
jgi:hypothetical protein